MLTLFKYRNFTNQTDKDRVRNILTRQEIYCQPLLNWTIPTTATLAPQMV